QLDQSFYLQEQLLALDSRLSVTAGVAAERSTNDADINPFYYYPHYSPASQFPPPFPFVHDIKPLGTHRQAREFGPYGSKYTGLSTTADAGAAGIGPSGTLGDVTIRPESEVETELGFDVTMLNSRAQFTATVYQKRLTSLLLAAGVPPSYGYRY